MSERPTEIAIHKPIGENEKLAEFFIPETAEQKAETLIPETAEQRKVRAKMFAEETAEQLEARLELELAEARKKARADEYKLNPNPQELYEYRVQINDAPGPLKLIGAGALFQSSGCRYLVDEFAGATASPRNSLPLELKQVAENSYVGQFYRDAMLDEDYFGNGVCHWWLSNVGARFSATGAEDETRFAAHIWKEDILPDVEKSVTFYYWKARYPTSKVDSISGKTDITKFRPEIRDELFTIVVTTKGIN